MNRVSAKTANGNQVSKVGRLDRRRPSDGLRLLETSEDRGVKLMATPFAARGLPAESDAPGFSKTISRVSHVGRHHLSTCRRSFQVPPNW